VPVKTHFCVSVKELLGREAELMLDAEDVVGHQNEVQAGTATSEALHVLVTEESEPVPMQGFKNIFFRGCIRHQENPQKGMDQPLSGQLLFDFEEFLPEEAELDPVKAEFKKFQIASLDFLNPGRLHFKAIQEGTLENKVPECVDVVKSHENHFEDLGIVNVQALSAERDRDRGKKGVHFIVGHNALIHEPLADLPRFLFLQASAKGRICNDTKSPVVLHVQGIHSAGPGTILVHGAPFVRDQGASFVLFAHFEKDQGNETVFLRDNHCVFVQKLFGWNAEGVLEADHIIRGQGDSDICTASREAGHTGAALKTKDMIGIHCFSGFFLVRTFHIGHG
jgi:hypothetical protein